MAAQNINAMQSLWDSSQLSGGNNAFVESLYEDYLADPSKLPAEWRAYFDRLQTTSGAVHEVAHSPIQRGFAALPTQSSQPAPHSEDDRKQASVLQLINAYRFLGVRAADLDPLKRYAKAEIAELNPAYYNLLEPDYDSTFNTGSLVGGDRKSVV